MRALFLSFSLGILLAAAAAAQIRPLICTANAGVVPLVRAEGVAEEVGQVVINCSGGTPTAAGAPIPPVNLQVFLLDANITSRLMDAGTRASEALLLIDDPPPANQFLATPRPPFTGVVNALGGGVYTPSADRPNVFAANQTAVNSIVWMNVPFDPPGEGANRVLRIVNIRANANQVGASGNPLLPSAITMFITISGEGSLALANPQLVVAAVQTGLTFSAPSVTYGQWDPGIKTLNLKFSERFSTAFRPDGAADQRIPGVIYNTESMFVNSAFNAPYNTAGRATQATQLIARFSNVPAGVSIYVPAGSGASYTNDAGQSTPVGNPLSLITASPPIWGNFPNPNTLSLVTAGSSGSTTDSSGLVGLTGGAGAAVYGLTEGSAGSIDTITIPVKIVYKANPAVGLGAATVSGDFVPGTSVFSSTVADPAPRFVVSPHSAATITFTSCATNMSLSRATMAFAAVAGGASLTPPQTALLSLTDPGEAWTATSSQPWLGVSPASGAGSATLTASLVRASLPAPGTASGTITVRDTHGCVFPVQITATLTVKSVTGAPFGSFDTPVDLSSGLAGAIPVTGWALDDIAVDRVSLWRDPVLAEPAGSSVYIGDAVFVPGGRPDVENMYANYPLASRAGWGYMLLTNFLPGQGNGTYRLYARATDREGHETLLGAKLITVANSAASKPFGTLDTPAQGGTASGTAYVNFGWALTPHAAYIPADGSTIRVYIDGQHQGAVTYNNPRADIDSLFPGYANSGGAVGYFRVNTTQLTNGLHSIAWIAGDSLGRSDGLGSRYFTVQNGVSGASSVQAVASYQEVAPLLGRGAAATPSVRRGFDPEAPLEQIPQAAAGRSESVVVEETERLEIHLPEGAAWTAYHRFGDELRPPPVGSSFDAEKGVFVWQLGPGFLGEHELVFVAADRAMRVPVRIVPLRPKLGRRLGRE